MPAPSTTHVSAPLTNMSLRVIQAETDFISTKIFPFVGVDKQADLYYEYNRGDLLRDEAAVRAPGTESAGGDYRVSATATYYCPVVAYHEDVPDQERANADSVLKTDEDHTQAVTHKLLISRDRRWGNGFYKAGVWGKQYTGGAAVAPGVDFVQWSDITNGHPITDIDTARMYMGQQVGFWPNKMVITPDVFNKLKNHPDIIGRIQYTQRAVITLDMLAALFELEEVLLFKSIYNSSADPAAPTFEYIGSPKSALLVYAEKAPGIKKPTAGSTFGWKGLLGSNAGGTRVKKFRVDTLGSDRIEGEMAMDMKVVCADLGIWFATCIA